MGHFNFWVLRTWQINDIYCCRCFEYARTLQREGLEKISYQIFEKFGKVKLVSYINGIEFFVRLSF